MWCVRGPFEPKYHERISNQARNLDPTIVWGWSEQRTLKMFTNFMFFANHLYYKIYGMVIFIKLADNEHYGCSPVVGVNSRKWDHLWEYLGATVFWWKTSSKTGKKALRANNIIGMVVNKWERQVQSNYIRACHHNFYVQYFHTCSAFNK